MKTRYHAFCQRSIWIFFLLLSACAYRMGSPERSLPSSYRQITVPLFRNLSMEPSVEVTFTNALVKEFERARIGRIVEPSQAEVEIEGEIKSISYRSAGKRDTLIPTGSVLATNYDIEVIVSIVVKRRADQSVLWAGEFSRTRSYNAPQVTLPGINTVNPLYNLSARRQNFDILAADMMAEAHDRLTENF